MNKNSRRSLGRFFYCLISLVLAVSTSHAQSPTLTTITDTIYRADGAPAAGQLVITWPAFTTASNKAVAAGEKTLTLGAGGVLSTQLAPNEGATPAGSYYKVVYKLSDGTTASEYWTVPILTPTSVGLIRATVVPSQVAAQLVTRQYVDSVLGTADIVHKAGAETITGAKTFFASPSVPTPSSTSDAANKSYVDAQAASGRLPNAAAEEWLHENWCGGLATSGQVGTLGWRAAGFGSGIAGFDSYGASAGNGGGCAMQFRQAATTTGAGLIVYLGGPDGTAQSQFNSSAWWVQSSINLETTASQTVRFGKSSTVGSETGTDGAFIRYIGGTDSQFMCEVIKAGVVTTSGIGVAPAANTWYKARIERDASGNVTCTVNSSSATIGAANTPGAVAVFDVFEVKSLTAAQWRLRSRYYEQHWTGLTR